MCYCAQRSSRSEPQKRFRRYNAAPEPGASRKQLQQRSPGQLLLRVCRFDRAYFQQAETNRQVQPIWIHSLDGLQRAKSNDRRVYQQERFIPHRFRFRMWNYIRYNYYIAGSVRIESTKWIHYSKCLCVLVIFKDTGVVTGSSSLPLASKVVLQWVLTNMLTEKRQVVIFHLRLIVYHVCLHKFYKKKRPFPREVFVHDCKHN